MKRFAIWLLAAAALLAGCSGSDEGKEGPGGGDGTPAIAPPKNREDVEGLLTWIQKAHFEYMWSGARPNSGLLLRGRTVERRKHADDRCRRLRDHGNTGRHRTELHHPRAGRRTAGKDRIVSGTRRTLARHVLPLDRRPHGQDHRLCRIERRRQRGRHRRNLVPDGRTPLRPPVFERRFGGGAGARGPHRRPLARHGMGLVRIGYGRLPPVALVPDGRLQEEFPPGRLQRMPAALPPCSGIADASAPGAQKGLYERLVAQRRHRQSGQPLRHPLRRQTQFGSERRGPDVLDRLLLRRSAPKG